MLIDFNRYFKASFIRQVHSQEFIFVVVVFLITGVPVSMPVSACK